MRDFSKFSDFVEHVISGPTLSFGPGTMILYHLLCTHTACSDPPGSTVKLAGFYNRNQDASEGYTKARCFGFLFLLTLKILFERHTEIANVPPVENRFSTATREGILLKKGNINHKWRER